MKIHNTATIEALVDEQLTGWRLWLARRHVSRCPACALTYRKHLHVRQMLAQNPPVAAMDATPEVFWSQIKTAIESGAAADARAIESATPRLSLADWLWLRPALAPVSALAGVVIVAGLLWLTSAPRPAGSTSFAQVTAVNTSLPDTVATPFDDSEAGVTVIWVSGLPWTPDMTEMKTAFAHLGT